MSDLSASNTNSQMPENSNLQPLHQQQSAQAPPAPPPPAASKTYNWNLIDFYRSSIRLLRENPKLLLIGVAALVLATGSTNYNFNLNLPEIPINLGPTQVEDNQVFFEDFFPAEESFQIDAPDSIQFETDEGDSMPGLQAPEDETFDQDFRTIRDETSNNELTEITPLPEVFLQQDIEPNLGEIEQIVQKNVLPVIENVESLAVEVNSRIPSWAYGLFFLQLFAFLLFAIVFSLALNAWVEAAVIEGVRLADSVGKNSWKLSNATKTAISKIMSMIWMNVIPTILIFLWMIVLVAAFSIMLAIGRVLNTITPLLFDVSLLAAVAIAVFCLLKIIDITLAQIAGQRLVVFESVKAREAFRMSLQLIKGSRSKMIWLGVSHVIVLGVFLSALAAAPLAITISGFIAGNIGNYLQTPAPELLTTILDSFTLGWISAIILSVILTTGLSIFARVAATVIKYANWHWGISWMLSRQTQPQQ